MKKKKIYLPKVLIRNYDCPECSTPVYFIRDTNGLVVAICKCGYETMPRFLPLGNVKELPELNWDEVKDPTDGITGYR